MARMGLLMGDALTGMGAALRQGGTWRAERLREAGIIPISADLDTGLAQGLAQGAPLDPLADAPDGGVWPPDVPLPIASHFPMVPPQAADMPQRVDTPLPVGPVPDFDASSLPDGAGRWPGTVPGAIPGAFPGTGPDIALARAYGRTTGGAPVRSGAGDEAGDDNNLLSRMTQAGADTASALGGFLADAGRDIADTSLEAGLRSVGETALDTAGSGLSGLHALAESGAIPITGPLLRYLARDNDLLDRMGEALKRGADRIAPAPEERTFITEMVADLTQLGIMAGLSALNPAVGIAAIAGIGADSMAERADALGIDDARRDQAVLLSAVLTAALGKTGLSAVVGRLPRPVQNRFLGLMAEIGIAGGGAAIDDVTEQVGRNAIARQVLDDPTGLLDGAGESAATAATTEAMLRTLLITALPGKYRGTAVERTLTGEAPDTGTGTAPLMDNETTPPMDTGADNGTGKETATGRQDSGPDSRVPGPNPGINTDTDIDTVTGTGTGPKPYTGTTPETAATTLGGFLAGIGRDIADTSPEATLRDLGAGALHAAGQGASGLQKLLESDQPALPPPYQPYRRLAQYWALRHGLLGEAGQDLKQAAARIAPAPEDRTIVTKTAHSLGAMALMVAMGKLSAIGGGILMMGMGADDMADRAEALDIDDARRDQAMFLAATVTLALEKAGLAAVVERLPRPVKRRFVGLITDIVIAAGGEAASEVTEQVARNAIARQVLDDPAGLLDGAGESAATAATTEAMLRTLLIAALPGKYRGTAVERTLTGETPDTGTTDTGTTDTGGRPLPDTGAGNGAGNRAGNGAATGQRDSGPDGGGGTDGRAPTADGGNLPHKGSAPSAGRHDPSLARGDGAINRDPRADAGNADAAATLKATADAAAPDGDATVRRALLRTALAQRLGAIGLSDKVHLRVVDRVTALTETGAVEVDGRILLTWEEAKPMMGAALRTGTGARNTGARNTGARNTDARNTDARNTGAQSTAPENTTPENSFVDAQGRKPILQMDVALTARDPQATLNYEAVHAMRLLGLFEDDEWRALTRSALGNRALMRRVDRAYGDLPADRRAEEAVAELYADYVRGSGPRPDGLLQRLLERIRQALQAIGDALRSQDIHAAEQVMAAMDSGAVGARTPRPGGGPGSDGRVMPLTPGRPAVILTGRELGPVASLPAMRARVERFYRNELQGQWVPMHKHGLNVTFTRLGLGKTLSNTAQSLTLQMLPALEDIIGTARITESVPVTGSKARSFSKAHFAENVVAVDGRTYRVGVTLFERHDGQVFYNLNADLSDRLKDADLRLHRLHGFTGATTFSDDINMIIVGEVTEK
ncbi:hypothetical protein [Eilatimonas milleporae]|uniref:Large polyvalent protein-associated domain-containing protein n=1 Tax=Eilatimonas milleporae TaxID=911205 RepID=A0A3M0CWW6_9PROT|nr:hypothetical protein [Eilatimonas milleporae]RMB11939.1 hypothetical protein BXY39_0426 [Eilatimonas milleporae]